MKILDIPNSGKCGRVVAFQSRYGLCLRELVIPRNTITPVRQHMREVFGSNSRVWGRRLNQEQRDRWNAAGGQVISHPRLGQQGPLTGEHFFMGINSVLGCVNLPPLWEPPARVAFGPSPVRELVITNDEAGYGSFCDWPPRRPKTSWSSGKRPAAPAEPNAGMFPTSTYCHRRWAA